MPAWLAHGLPVPGEAAARRPIRCTGRSRRRCPWPSATKSRSAPLQMALAYSAIANGGELLEPGLVREIRDPDGTVMYRASGGSCGASCPRISRASSAKCWWPPWPGARRRKPNSRSYIVPARPERRGGRVRGRVWTQRIQRVIRRSLPGRDPQYVILVRSTTRPELFGGKTTAPLFKVILESALAARDASLDRTVLAADRREPRSMSAPAPPCRSPRRSHRPSYRLSHRLSHRLSPRRPAWQMRPQTASVHRYHDRRAAPSSRSTGRSRRRPRRSLRPWSCRICAGWSCGAVHALHWAGLEVRLTGGPRGTTDPVAGTAVRTGTVVRLGAGA